MTYLTRRKFLQTSALGAVGIIAAPAVLRAQGAPVKVGILHPVSGALSPSGQQGRIGATLAVEEINAAGGIKSLGGAKIDPVLGDAQSTPEGGNAEVEKMNAAGVAAIVGGFASGICLAASQTAARAISSGSPIRLYGISLRSSRYASGVSHAGRLIGVRIAPGPIEFTRMRYGATSCASDFIISMTPPLLAA